MRGTNTRRPIFAIIMERQMINHRVDNQRRCALLLFFATLLFPLVSVSQTYSAIAHLGGSIMALGNDGFAYDPVRLAIDSNGNPTGSTWGSGIFPGQTTQMSQLLSGIAAVEREARIPN